MSVKSKLQILFSSKKRFLYLANKGAFRSMDDEKYLSKMYYARLGKKLDLVNPKTFNEKLQWLKLYDRKPIYTTMVDKYAVKQYIADRIGEEYIIPTLGVWDKFDDIDFDDLPDQFVLKCTHDSGGLAICRDKKNFNRQKAKKKIERSLKKNYYWSGREWPYKDVPPRIIAEEYLEDKDDSPSKPDVISGIRYSDLQKKYGLLDYKFMCFDGKVQALFLDIGVIGASDGHAEQYYRNVYDRNARLLSVKETRENYPVPVILPENLQEMIAVAERLSANIPHLRVDLYRLNDGRIKVGELTFFHGSGLSNIFIPSEWDKTFGDWIHLPKKL